MFDEPVAKVEAEGVVLTTYFNSRVDPLRCYKHKVRQQQRTEPAAGCTENQGVLYSLWLCQGGGGRISSKRAPPDAGSSGYSVRLEVVTAASSGPLLLEGCFSTGCNSNPIWPAGACRAGASSLTRWATLSTGT